MNNIDDLQRKLDRLIKNPGDARLYHEIGVLLYQVKDLENAVLYLKRAYEISPEDADILYNYALLLYSQCKWRESVKIYQACFALDPADEGVSEKLRDLYYRLGAYQEAAKYIRKPGKDTIND